MAFTIGQSERKRERESKRRSCDVQNQETDRQAEEGTREGHIQG